MATLVVIQNARSEKIGLADGKSISVDTETIGGCSDDAEMYHISGVYSIPIDGTSGICQDTQDNNIIIATHDYRFNKTLDKGEAILYSMDANGVIKATAFVNKSGEFVINDGTDYGVKYSALETAFNNLRDDYNNFKALHKHGGVLVGTGSTAVSDMTTPNAADITQAKVLKVRI